MSRFIIRIVPYGIGPICSVTVNWTSALVLGGNGDRVRKPGHNPLILPRLKPPKLICASVEFCVICLSSFAAKVNQS